MGRGKVGWGGGRRPRRRMVSGLTEERREEEGRVHGNRRVKGGAESVKRAVTAHRHRPL